MGPRVIVDLFAGPRGWSEGLARLGYDDVGIELDADACATASAAGHTTIRADVANYPTDRFEGRLEGLIASPPCQTFSAAGLREGVAELETILDHVRECARGWRPLMESLRDRRTELVVEPLRWIWRTDPTWVALEQVVEVQPIWDAYAGTLREWGFHVWTGELNAADYGVPQTRRRSFLLAHLERTVAPPTPTHTDGDTGTLFGDLQPWVTMADALGWGFDDDPARVVCGNRSPRWLYDDETDARRGRTIPSLGFARRDDLGTSPDGYRERDRRNGDEPSFALTEKARSWTFTRPATTVQGDPRIWAPGHKVNGDDRRRLGEDEANNRYGDRAGTDAIRLEIPDALVLQSFPPDYPVRGSRTSQFAQIGNAVPPRMAFFLLGTLVGSGH